MRVESQHHNAICPVIMNSNTSPSRVRGAVAPPFEHLTRGIIQVAQRLRHTWGEPILLFDTGLNCSAAGAPCSRLGCRFASIAGLLLR